MNVFKNGVTKNMKGFYLSNEDITFMSNYIVSNIPHYLYSQSGLYLIYVRNDFSSTCTVRFEMTVMKF